MGTNKRYADTIDIRTTDITPDAAIRIPPCTLPHQAYGPQPIEWSAPRVPVWAWITWPHKPAERIPAVAHGWNDRIVIVYWMSAAGEINTVVWRSAVTRRTA